jgi:hypothetical protein
MPKKGNTCEKIDNTMGKKQDAKIVFLSTHVVFLYVPMFCLDSILFLVFVMFETHRMCL